MLRVDKSTLGPFGLPELDALVKAKGWEAMLPGALNDAELLQLSDQLVDFLRNDGLALEPRQDRAAMSMTLRLTLPLFRVVLSPMVTRLFYAVPRTSVARTASG